VQGVGGRDALAAVLEAGETEVRGRAEVETELGRHVGARRRGAVQCAADAGLVGAAGVVPRRKGGDRRRVLRRGEAEQRDSRGEESGQRRHGWEWDGWGGGGAILGI